MRTAPLLDIAALVLFAIFARMAHPPFSLTAVLDAFWPWAVGALLGWVIVSFLNLPNDYAEGAVVWPSAIIGGLVLWFIVNGRMPHYSMIIVTVIMSSLLMFGWRVVAMRRNARASRAA